MKIPIDDIICSNIVQSRMKRNELTVIEYHGAIERGVELPLIDVFAIGDKFYVTDGFHRLAAHRKAGHTEIDCVVHQGDMAAAMRFAAASNRDHGLPRSNEDKKRAITVYLDDPEWSLKSDAAIAHAVGVNESFVARVRRAMESGDDRQLEIWVRRRGVDDGAVGEGEAEECADGDVPAAGGTLPDMDAAALGQHTAIEITLPPEVATYRLAELPVGDLAADQCVLTVRTILPRLRDAEALAGRWGFTVQCTLIPPPIPGQLKRMRTVALFAAKGHENLGGPEAIIERLYAHGEGIALFRHRSGWKHWPMMRNDSSSTATTDTMRRGLRALCDRVADRDVHDSGD